MTDGEGRGRSTGVQGAGPQGNRPAPKSQTGPKSQSEASKASVASWLVGSPREVLARLADGDPLEMRPRIAARARERALIIDGDRAHLRALAHVARAAGRRRGPLDVWLTARIDVALDELVAELARSSGAGQRPWAVLRDLGHGLGWTEAQLRTSCVAFNGLEPDDRQAFFALVIEARSLDELVCDGPLSATELARRARHALKTMLSAALGAAADRGELDEPKERKT